MAGVEVEVPPGDGEHLSLPESGPDRDEGRQIEAGATEGGEESGDFGRGEGARGTPRGTGRGDGAGGVVGQETEASCGLQRGEQAAIDVEDGSRGEARGQAVTNEGLDHRRGEPLEVDGSEERGEVAADDTAPGPGLEPQAAPQVMALLVCDAGNRSLDGKDNLLGVFDSLRPPRLPSRASFWLYVRTLETQSGEMEAVLVDPAGTRLFELTAVAETPPGEISRKPIQMGLLAPCHVEFRRAGVHWWEVRFQGALLARLPLNVEEVEGADVSAAGGLGATDVAIPANG